MSEYAFNCIVWNIQTNASELSMGIQILCSWMWPEQIFFCVKLMC